MLKNIKASLIRIALVFIWIPASALSAEPVCDRQCLIDLAEAYMDALVAHDPQRVPLAKNIRTVENLKPIQPGSGLWRSASARPEQFKLFVPDVNAQQIGFIVVMKETSGNGSEIDIQVAFRLALQAGEIIEAEHLINHEIDENNIGNLQNPRLPLISAVPAAYKDSRDRLLSIGASYYDALVNSNGSLAPFGDDCVRHENGMQSSRNTVPENPMTDFAVFASMGCEAQLNTQLYSYIDSIDFRRVEIADEQTGLVMGLSHFRQAMGKSEYRTMGVPGHEVLTDDRESYDLAAIHIFKIWGGKIHEVEAVGYFADYMAKTGWE